MYTQQSETPTKKVTRKVAIKSGEKPKHFVVHILLMHQKILGWIMFFGISAKVPAKENLHINRSRMCSYYQDFQKSIRRSQILYAVVLPQFCHSASFSCHSFCTRVNGAYGCAGSCYFTVPTCLGPKKVAAK